MTTHTMLLLLSLLALPHTAHGEVTLVQWATLFINTLQAFFLYWVQGHSDYSMYNFDTIVDDLVVVLRDYMPESLPTDNVEEMDVPLRGYLCLAQGTVRDLKSMTKVGTIQYKWEADGSVKINTFFTMREFVVHYGVFYMHFMGMKKRGSLNFNFQRNQVQVGLRIAPVFHWWSGGVKCIFSITKLKITELGDIKVTVESDGWTHGDLTGQSATHALRNNNEFIVTALKVNLLRGIYDNIQTGNSLVCTDPKIDWQADELKVMVDPKFTERFDRRCGKNSGASAPKPKRRFHRPHLRRRDRNT